jgi:NADPH:quinone reductase-like Zn-dependent oxidoreductase
VLDVLGALPFQRDWLGVEAAGTVTAVGEGVTECRVGDEVLGIVPDAFAHHAVTRATLLATKPSALSFADAASLPVAFLTAAMVFDWAKPARGERGLIHAAAGGVGQAALQLMAHALGQAGAQIVGAAVDWPRMR